MEARALTQVNNYERFNARLDAASHTIHTSDSRGVLMEDENSHDGSEAPQDANTMTDCSSLRLFRWSTCMNV